MNRRRMMMSGERKALITVSFSEETASGTCVEYGGVKYREGSFKCKKGETIKCVCFNALPGNPTAIYVDGKIAVNSYIADVDYKLKVMNDLDITADSYRMWVATKE